MNHAYKMLGKYALLQHLISMQRTDDKIGNIRKVFATETEKLSRLAKGSHDNLFVAKTVFPFVLFADTLKIDRQKVTIVHNDFFLEIANSQH